jgi:AraC-like DNA-binding protein
MPPKECALITPIAGVVGAKVVAAYYRGHSFRPHFHPFLTLGILEAGEAHLTVNGTRWRVGTQTVFLIAPNSPHFGESADPVEGHRYLGLHIDPFLGKASSPAEERLFSTSCAIDDPHFRQMVGALIRELAACDDPERNLRTMDILLSEVGARLRPPPEPERPIPCGPWVEVVRSLIAATFDRRWTLDQISDVVGISKFHLSRTFKQATGLSPTDYGLQLRISRACDLIAAGAEAASVATECGFADQAHLIRTFKGHLGTTPRLYAQAGARGASPQSRPSACTT